MIKVYPKMIVFCPKTTTVVFLPYKATLKTGKRYPIGLDLTKFSPYRATLKTQIGFSSYEVSQLVLTLHSYSQNAVILARVPLFRSHPTKLLLKLQK